MYTKKNMQDLKPILVLRLINGQRMIDTNHISPGYKLSAQNLVNRTCLPEGRLHELVKKNFRNKTDKSERITNDNHPIMRPPFENLSVIRYSPAHLF